MQSWKMEFRLLWRSRISRMFLLAYLILALLALYWGQQRVDREQTFHAQVVEQTQQVLASYQAEGAEALDPGYLGYYLFMPVWQTPEVWAGVIHGERHEHPVQLRIRLLGLQGQLHASEIHNISALAYGHLDLAFVWLFVMPLLIGALSVNLLAEEKMRGRWPIIAAQSSNAVVILWRRLLLRFGMLAIVNSVVLLAVLLITPVSFGISWLLVAMLVLLYQLFWMVLAGWIISLKRQMAFNTLLYLCIWLILSFVIPGVGYLLQAQQQQAAEHIGMMTEQRQYMHDRWDSDRQADLDNYLQRFPEWADTAPLGEGFDWKWYFAMQHMSDLMVEDRVEDYRQQRLKALQLQQAFLWSSPVLNLQTLLNRMAGNDTLAHQAFLDQVIAYHDELRDFYYPFLFHDASFSEADFARIPAFVYQAPKQSFLLMGLMQFALGFVLLLGLLLSRRKHWLESDL